MAATLVGRGHAAREMQPRCGSAGVASSWGEGRKGGLRIGLWTVLKAWRERAWRESGLAKGGNTQPGSLRFQFPIRRIGIPIRDCWNSRSDGRWNSEN